MTWFLTLTCLVASSAGCSTALSCWYYSTYQRWCSLGRLCHQHTLVLWCLKLLFDPGGHWCRSKRVLVTWQRPKVPPVLSEWPYYLLLYYYQWVTEWGLSGEKLELFFLLFILFPYFLTLCRRPYGGLRKLWIVSSYHWPSWSLFFLRLLFASDISYFWTSANFLIFEIVDLATRNPACATLSNSFCSRWFLSLDSVTRSNSLVTLGRIDIVLILPCSGNSVLS